MLLSFKSITWRHSLKTNPTILNIFLIPWNIQRSSSNLLEPRECPSSVSPSGATDTNFLLGLNLQWYWCCWNSSDLPVSRWVLACAFVSLLLLPLPVPGKADFLLCLFSIVNKEPGGPNPALTCIITSKGCQWSYAPVLSQIHSKVVQIHKTLCALQTSGVQPSCCP